MKTAEEFFSEDERGRIDQAVAEAEKKTSAEIVPVLATASGRYDRAEDVVGLWVGLVALAALWILFQGIGRDAWGQPALKMELIPVVVIVVVGFIVGAVLAARVGPLRRLFIPRGQMQAEVEAKARQGFFDQEIHKTAGGTGVILYVSLYERMAVVLGDEKVNEYFTASDWENVRDMIVDGFKQGRACDGYCRAIARAGDLLAEHLPIQPDDVDELPNRLRIVE